MGLTGQDLTRIALDRLAGGSLSELVRVLRLNELTDSQYVVKSVERWRDGKHEPSYEFAIRALDALGAINWEALHDPRESTAATLDRIANKTGRARARAQQQQHGQPRQAEGGSRR